MQRSAGVSVSDAPTLTPGLVMVAVAAPSYPAQLCASTRATMLTAPVTLSGRYTPRLVGVDDSDGTAKTCDTEAAHGGVGQSEDGETVSVTWLGLDVGVAVVSDTTTSDSLCLPHPRPRAAATARPRPGVSRCRRKPCRTTRHPPR